MFERVQNTPLDLPKVSTSNHIFGRTSWNKLLEPISKNFEFQFSKIFKYDEDDLAQKLPEPNMRLLVNHTKPTNTQY